MNNIYVTREYLQRLIVAYRCAVRDKKMSFRFEGNEFLTAYAKYFLIHWAPQFDLEFKP